jgi:hypothetical protein
MTASPAMTVIPIVDKQRQRGARCLDSILSQNVIARS